MLFCMNVGEFFFFSFLYCIRLLVVDMYMYILSNLYLHCIIYIWYIAYILYFIYAMCSVHILWYIYMRARVWYRVSWVYREYVIKLTYICRYLWLKKHSHIQVSAIVLNIWSIWTYRKHISWLGWKQELHHFWTANAKTF